MKARTITLIMTIIITLSAQCPAKELKVPWGDCKKAYIWLNFSNFLNLPEGETYSVSFRINGFEQVVGMYKKVCRKDHPDNIDLIKPSRLGADTYTLTAGMTPHCNDVQAIIDNDSITLRYENAEISARIQNHEWYIKQQDPIPGTAGPSH